VRIANELQLVFETLLSRILCSHYIEAGRLAFILLHLDGDGAFKPTVGELKASYTLVLVVSPVEATHLSLAGCPVWECWLHLLMTGKFSSTENNQQMI